jgi:RimJ/RimL family protein N-acetyltransferase
MKISNPIYIFKSERLGFRNWIESDIDKMATINDNAAVMEYFPSTQTLEQTKAFIDRMQQLYTKTGFCYFAVDTLNDNKFIGFIGLAEQNFKSNFTPCIDIGWRLHPDAWYKGYATEGAKACLEYAFISLKLEQVYAMASAINLKSIDVMKKIGMHYVSNFIHPLLENNERLKDCVLYECSK